MGKLSGITVVDLTQFLPGPMMTVMMADQGARVIKIEPNAGDPARVMEPREAGHSVWFANLNRGKESVVLDLKSEEGKAALVDLCRKADVFVEGFRVQFSISVNRVFLKHSVHINEARVNLVSYL